MNINQLIKLAEKKSYTIERLGTGSYIYSHINKFDWKRFDGKYLQFVKLIKSL